MEFTKKCSYLFKITCLSSTTNQRCDVWTRNGMHVCKLFENLQAGTVLYFLADADA